MTGRLRKPCAGKLVIYGEPVEGPLDIGNPGVQEAMVGKVTSFVNG
jgi:hypothetical protein